MRFHAYLIITKLKIILINSLWMNKQLYFFYLFVFLQQIAYPHSLVSHTFMKRVSFMFRQ